MVAGSIGLAGCGPVVEDTRPGQPVKTRQDAFKEILREFEPMGVMIRTGKFEAEEFARMTDALVAARERPWVHFGPDTDYPPSKAKPAVWSEPVLFDERRNAFFAATDALQVAAQGGQEDTVRAAYERVHSACKDCHDQFKGR
jgi:cytochrome c556